MRASRGLGNRLQAGGRYGEGLEEGFKEGKDRAVGE